MSREKFRTFHKMPENGKNNWRIYGAVFSARFQLAQRFCTILDCEMMNMVCFCHKKRPIEKENRRAYSIAEGAVFLKEPRLYSGIPRHVLESFARCLLPIFKRSTRARRGDGSLRNGKRSRTGRQNSAMEKTPDSGPCGEIPQGRSYTLFS